MMPNSPIIKRPRPSLFPMPLRISALNTTMYLCTILCITNQRPNCGGKSNPTLPRKDGAYRRDPGSCKVPQATRSFPLQADRSTNDRPQTNNKVTTTSASWPTRLRVDEEYQRQSRPYSKSQLLHHGEWNQIRQSLTAKAPDHRQHRTLMRRPTDEGLIGTPILLTSIYSSCSPSFALRLTQQPWFPS